MPKAYAAVPLRHRKAVQSSLWLSRARSMCRDWPTSDMIMEREEALKDLKQFQENFKLDSPALQEGQQEKQVKPVKQQSLELEKQKEDLKHFHKAFNLCVGPSNGQGKEAPSTLTLSAPSDRLRSHRKRRRSRKPPRSQNFDDVYMLTGEELGRGAHSSVSTCRNKTTGQEFAVKIVPKTSNRVREMVLREREILYTCRNNRHILQLVDSFEDDERFHLVFEKMSGGPLLAHIRKHERFTERDASLVVHEVASALAFLHDNGIAHRDLKPDNILCERTDKVVPIRICDFDLSSCSVLMGGHTPTTTPMLLTPVGSAEYMAPEVVDLFLGEAFSYDKKCDLWSLGVTLYMMLSGHPPFSGHCGDNCGWEKGETCEKCQDMLLTRIKNGEYEFSEKEWEGISSEAKELISQLLVKDSQQRLSAHQVLQHPWILQEAPETPLATPGILSRHPSIADDLSQYAASCLKFTRQLSSHVVHEADPTPNSQTYYHTQQLFTLSPPGSSDLALRRTLSPPSSQSHLRKQTVPDRT